MRRIDAAGLHTKQLDTAQIEELLKDELRLSEEVLDVYVIEPRALSAEDRAHIEALIEAHAPIREFVDELRAFYSELEAEGGALPKRVRAFIDRVQDGI